MPHSDISSGFGFYAGDNSGNSSSSGLSGSNTADVLASMGINLGTPSSSSSTGSMSVSGSLFGSPSSNSGEPFSPVHAWYKQLAVQYAHSAAAAGQTSPVRFLSVQCDGARARAVARRLGVSAPLAVALVDAASGRKLQEVIGTKIQTELPNGGSRGWWLSVTMCLQFACSRAAWLCQPHCQGAAFASEPCFCVAC